ncbi:MAG: HAMP domain-containing histidine kinase [Streptococcaceae bacterium]|nr:HAMP domain-containing histidine kinase [Streptococcaceae bacterium]
MKKQLTSIFLKMLITLLGFIFAVSSLRQMSLTYHFYLRQFWGNFLTFPKTLSLALFALCILLLALMILFSPRQAKRSDFFRKIDAGSLIFLAFFASYISNLWIRESSSALEYFLFSALAYFGTISALAEFLSRIRDRQFNFYWLAFFKQFPIKQVVGSAMALLLAGNLGYFIVSLIVKRSAQLPIDPAHGQVIMRQVISGSPLFSLIFALNLLILSYLVVFILKLSERYERANQEKIRSERFKAELITNVSHDMKTPLTSIINYVDLLKNLPITNPDFASYTSILEKKSNRLKNLISDLIEASKAGTGNLNIQLESVNLTEFLGQIVGEFDEDFTAKSLTLIYQEPDSVLKVQADVKQLWRVLENIFNNALKYSQAGTRVFARIKAEKEKISLQLVNISSEAISQSEVNLTEQFIRGDMSRHTEGNGLGLYIAKSLVELMKAEFKIKINGDLFEVNIDFHNLEEK